MIYFNSLIETTFLSTINSKRCHLIGQKQFLPEHRHQTDNTQLIFTIALFRSLKGILWQSYIVRLHPSTVASHSHKKAWRLSQVESMWESFTTGWSGASPERATYNQMAITHSRRLMKLDWNSPPRWHSENHPVDVHVVLQLKATTLSLFFKPWVWGWNKRKQKHPLFILAGWLLGPRRSHVGNEGHVVVGAGGRLVGQVRRQKWWPVVLDDHGVVLRHVDRRGELVVCWGTRTWEKIWH